MVASSAVGAGVVVRRVFNSAIAAVPRVFSVADLRDHLSEALPQWQAYMLDHLEDGSLHQVASDAPVFYKHLSGEPLSDEDRCTALKRVYPSLVVVAGSSLWRQSLSDQQDARFECAVSDSAAECYLPGVALRKRPPGWWQVVKHLGGVAGESHGIPLLAPELVVADAARFRDVWMPDHDAIKWAALSSQQLEKMTEALAQVPVDADVS